MFGNQPTDLGGLSKGVFETVWHNSIRPLLESLIKTNRIADAETIIFDTAKTNKDIQRMAADLALSCGKQDLQVKWLAFQIPEKKAPDLATFLFKESLLPRLITVNEIASSQQQTHSMLNQGQLIDWGLEYYPFDAEMSELMMQREGWPDKETHWALLHKNKMLADGPGLPTIDALTKILEQYNVETPANAYRRFILEHPAQFDAKEMLLRDLKRIAEQKTKEKLGSDAGKDAALMLAGDDDQAVWGDYSILFRQMLPYFLEQNRPQSWMNGPCDSEFFIHSPLMKNHVHTFLPQVEACLKRQPTDTFLWSVWVALSALNEQRSFRDFREALVLPPLYSINPPYLPPVYQAEQMMMRYRAKSNWQGIIDLQEWRWEIIQSNIQQTPARTNGYLTFIRWMMEMQYLSEAYLRLEKNREADEMIRTWSQADSWRQIKQSAVGLAEKCGNSSLAEQWGKL
jgi:hypothetical protein